MEIIDTALINLQGTNGPVREGFVKVNINVNYLNAFIQQTRQMCGFNREDVSTLGILQYCHSASSGIVDQITADGTYTVLTEQTHFADGETPIADRTLIQYHSSDQSTFSYWHQGAFVETTDIKTFQLPDTPGQKYIEYNAAGALRVAPDAQDAIVSGTLVALIVNNTNSGNNIWFADERHGMVMDGQTHLNMHMTNKFKWVDGGLLTGLENNGTTFAAVSAGRCGDEDIPMVYGEETTAPYMYVDDSGQWEIGGEDDNKLAHFVDAKVVYNPLTDGNGALTEINNDYIVMTMMRSNNKKHPLVKMLGQILYGNRSEARDHLYSAYYEIEEAGLPNQEMTPIANYIVHNESAGQIEKGADEEIWIDYRHGHPVAMF